MKWLILSSVSNENACVSFTHHFNFSQTLFLYKIILKKPLRLLCKAWKDFMKPFLDLAPFFVPNPLILKLWHIPLHSSISSTPVPIHITHPIDVAHSHIHPHHIKQRRSKHHLEKSSPSLELSTPPEKQSFIQTFPESKNNKVFN